MNIQMVDLKGQYEKNKEEIDRAILSTVSSTLFINGPEVKAFESSLKSYLNAGYVIPCANGTDALQIAMMALGLSRGDEVIVPAFTYVATAEVIALFGLVPVWVDVDENTFNIDPDAIKTAITPKTKAIVPVHLYGQCADMEAIMKIAANYELKIIEDTAQAIGAVYTLSDGKKIKAGLLGDIGCTSFFPSKNLGCYGDGGAIYTNDISLGADIAMVANHGQRKKYHHEKVGVNSRLDTIQAAVLQVKLKYLDEYTAARQWAAARYDALLANIPEVKTPYRNACSTHVFHQYTITLTNGSRNELKSFLEREGIPSMIYYPVPMHLQHAYVSNRYPEGSFPVSEKLCNSVLSLPMHTELTEDQIQFIAGTIRRFFSK